MELGGVLFCIPSLPGVRQSSCIGFSSAGIIDVCLHSNTQPYNVNLSAHSLTSKSTLLHPCLFLF